MCAVGGGDRVVAGEAVEATGPGGPLDTLLRPLSRLGSFPAMRALRLGCAACVIALLAGCGKSLPVTSHGRTAGAARLTKREAVAFAKAVNLRGEDLPGLESTRPGGEAKGYTQAAVEYARCAGGVDPRRELVYRASATFRTIGAGRVYFVASYVRVMPTAALAARDERSRTSMRGYACGVQEEAEQRTPRTLHLLGAVSGVPGSYALRGESRRPPADPSDTLGFHVGAAEVALVVVGVDGPASNGVEHRLLKALYRRAEQAAPLLEGKRVSIAA